MHNPIVRIALFELPNGRPTQHTRILMQGELTHDDALKRAYTIVHSDRSISREYLLNCLDIGNFSISSTS